MLLEMVWKWILLNGTIMELSVTLGGLSVLSGEGDISRINCLGFVFSAFRPTQVPQICWSSYRKFFDQILAMNFFVTRARREYRK